MRIFARIIACESSFMRGISSLFFFFYDNCFSNVQQSLAQYEVARNSIKSKKKKKEEIKMRLQPHRLSRCFCRTLSTARK